MPYKIKGKCIYKKTGKKVGCTKGSVKKYMKALHANVKESLQDSSINDMIGDHYKFETIIEEKGLQKVIYKCIDSESKLILNFKSTEYISGEIKFEDPSTIPTEDEVEMAGQDAMNRLGEEPTIAQESLTFGSLYKQIMNLEEE